MVKKKDLQVEKSFQFGILEYQDIESEQSTLTSISVFIKFPSISSWPKQFRKIEMEPRKNSLPPNQCFPTNLTYLYFLLVLGKEIIYEFFNFTFYAFL